MAQSEHEILAAFNTVRADNRQNVDIIVVRKFAERLRDFSGDEILDAIATGLLSYDPLVAKFAAQALVYHSSDRAFEILEFLLMRKDDTPLNPILQDMHSKLKGIRNHLEGTPKEDATKALPNFAGRPGFLDFVEALEAQQSSSEVHQKAADALQFSADPRLPELALRLQSNSNSFVRGAALRALQAFDGPEVFEMLKAGIRATEHAVKAGAADGIAGRNDPRYLDLIQEATHAAYSEVRRSAYFGLSQFPIDGTVRALYIDGLKDADRTIRISVLWSLNQRSDPEAKFLVELASGGSILPRSFVEQGARVSDKDKIADRSRHHNLEPYNIYYFEGFKGDIKRKRDRMLEKYSGLDIQAIAKLMLSNGPGIEGGTCAVRAGLIGTNLPILDQ